MTLDLKKQSSSQYGAFWVCIICTIILVACCIGIAGLPMMGIKIALWATPFATGFTAIREIATIHDKRKLAAALNLCALFASAWFLLGIIGSIAYMSWTLA